MLKFEVVLFTVLHIISDKECLGITVPLPEVTPTMAGVTAPTKDLRFFREVSPDKARTIEIDDSLDVAESQIVNIRIPYMIESKRDNVRDGFYPGVKLLQPIRPKFHGKTPPRKNRNIPMENPFQINMRERNYRQLQDYLKRKPYRSVSNDDTQFQPIIKPSPVNVIPINHQTFDTIRSQVQFLKDRQKLFFQHAEDDFPVNRHYNTQPADEISYFRQREKELGQPALYHDGNNSEQVSGENYYSLNDFGKNDRQSSESQKTNVLSSRQSDENNSAENSSDEINSGGVNRNNYKNSESQEKQQHDYDYSQQQSDESVSTTSEEVPTTPARKRNKFVPRKTYSQVRHSERVQRRPKLVEEPRVKEKISTSKSHIVYREEGYDDNDYDHGKEQKAGEFNEVEKRQKDIKRKRRSVNEVPDKVEEDGRVKNGSLSEVQFQNVTGTITGNVPKVDQAAEAKAEKDQVKELERAVTATSAPTNSTTNDTVDDEIDALPIPLALKQRLKPLNLKGAALMQYIEEALKNSSIYLPDEPISADARISESRVIPVQSKKYPYYKLPTDVVGKNSPLRYAQNAKRPRSSIYATKNDIECHDIDEQIDPIPNKIKNNNFDKTHPGRQGKRLRNLGDKIDCLKEKFFGKNPLDNPLFEENISVPDNVFNATEYIQSHIKNNVYKDVLNNIRSNLLEESETDDKKATTRSDESSDVSYAEVYEDLVDIPLDPTTEIPKDDFHLLTNEETPEVTKHKLEVQRFIAKQPKLSGSTIPIFDINPYFPKFTFHANTDLYKNYGHESSKAAVTTTTTEIPEALPDAFYEQTQNDQFSIPIRNVDLRTSYPRFIEPYRTPQYQKKRSLYDLRTPRISHNHSPVYRRRPKLIVYSYGGN